MSIEYHSLGDFKLQSGIVLPNALIAYKTFGDSSSPAVLYPSWFSGEIKDNQSEQVLHYYNSSFRKRAIHKSFQHGHQSLP
jgi:homoserine acetyltransferase